LKNESFEKVLSDIENGSNLPTLDPTYCDIHSGRRGGGGYPYHVITKVITAL